MLRYLAYGGRRYGSRPVHIHRRGSWEFLAVLRGACAPLLPGAAAPVAVASTLWVFSPEAAHGWTAARRGSCQVAVLHVDIVPPAVEHLARGGSCAVRLDAEGRREIRRITAEFRAAERSREPLRQLRLQGALIRLAQIGRAHV